MSTLFLTGPRFLEHRNRAYHPERPERLDAIWNLLRAQGLWEQVTHGEFDAADEVTLLACHTPELVRLIRELSEAGGGEIDLDTGTSPASYEVALLAVGAACRAVDSVIAGKAPNAFVCARPPGHHATSGTAMGFCLFNTVACAARHAQRAHGLQRVAILDWDVHHGNGTEEIFYGDADVLFVSLHQSPLYPGTGRSQDTGRGAGQGFTLNLPLPEGRGDDEYLHVWREVVGPRVYEFDPDLILVSAGYDAHKRDPLAGMELSASGFAALTRDAKRWARQLCGGKLVCILEGGYDLQGLSESVAATLEVLLEA